MGKIDEKFDKVHKEIQGNLKTHHEDVEKLKLILEMRN